MKNIFTTLVLAMILIGLFVYMNLNGENSHDPVVDSVEENASSSANGPSDSEDQDITVDTVIISDGTADFGVYALVSTGERIKIAESDNPDTIENYFNIVTYHQALVSPNKKFIALQASLFEDSFVQVYDANTGTLHDRQWGRVIQWTDKNLLVVDSCDLSGEECTYLISSSSVKPWEFISREME
jgi:hypothetical protein